MPDKIAESLLKINSVALRTNPPFRYSSGALSPIYTDNRLLMSFTKEREMIVSALAALIKKNKLKYDGFAGTATAGIPWAAFLSQKLRKPMVYVRSKSKDHGKENQVEGKITEGKAYIVVEDLISTGGSSISTAHAVREKKGIVEDCIAIFTYELKKSIKNFEAANVKLHTLTNFTSLIETALNKKYINKQQISHLKDWHEHPEGWTPV